MCPTLKESDESGMTAATQQKVTKDVSRSALSLSLSLTHSLALCGCLCGIMGLLSLWEHNTHTHSITHYHSLYIYVWVLWDFMAFMGCYGIDNTYDSILFIHLWFSLSRRGKHLMPMSPWTRTHVWFATKSATIPRALNGKRFSAAGHRAPGVRISHALMVGRTSRRRRSKRGLTGGATSRSAKKRKR